MNQFMNNRYVQIVGLTLGLAVLIYLLLWVIFSLIGLSTFPVFLQLVVALGTAGVIVSKFFAFRIG